LDPGQEYLVVRGRARIRDRLNQVTPWWHGTLPGQGAAGQHQRDQVLIGQAYGAGPVGLGGGFDDLLGGAGAGDVAHGLAWSCAASSAATMVATARRSLAVSSLARSGSTNGCRTEGSDPLAARSLLIGMSRALESAVRVLVRTRTVCPWAIRARWEWDTFPWVARAASRIDSPCCARAAMTRSATVGWSLVGGVVGVIGSS